MGEIIPMREIKRRFRKKYEIPHNMTIAEFIAGCIRGDFNEDDNDDNK